MNMPQFIETLTRLTNRSTWTTKAACN